MQSPLAYFRGIRHPEAFHGRKKTRNFFEGWYVKLVSADGSQRWAVIPGIFIGPPDASGRGRVQAFIQVLDGITGRSWFHEFDADAFAASDTEFSVNIGGNRFDKHGVSLDLPQLKGQISYASPVDPWPTTLAAPGIMGWYGLVPFMECFHGIVSFGHELTGTLEVEGQAIKFDAGRGYIEKDWGQAFPSGYVWMQTNHFASEPSASFIGSVAIIPWLNGAFRGFIVGLKHSGHLFRWATYTAAKEEVLTIDDSHVRWNLDSKDGRLEIVAERKAGGLLHAPIRTEMHRRVEETMLSIVQIRHLDSNGRVLFEDTGDFASVEVFGDLERLLALKH